MLVLPLLGGISAFIYSMNQDIIYEARATLLVQQSRGGFAPGVSDFRVSEQLASTYRRLVTTRPFLQRVADQPGTELTSGQLRSMVSATTGTNPPVIEIAVRHSDPLLATLTADLVAQEFIDYVVEQRLAEIARLQSAAAAQGIVNVGELVAAQLTAVDSLSLLEPVIPPERPVLPRTRQNVIIGVIMGIILAAGVALLLESLGDTVKQPDEVSRRFGVGTLGTVFRWSQQETGENELVIWSAPNSNYAETFRQIRANFQFAIAGRPGKRYLFCSPGPGEGKSTTACNLAVALAQAGKKVVVVDGDLRRATVHRKFRDVKREPGLSNYLADPATEIDAAVHPTEVDGVHVVPSGPTPPNPAELLGTQRMAHLLERLEERFDYVLVDSAPVLLVADALVLAAQVNGAVMVVDGSRTRMSSLQAALEAIRNTKSPIVGVTINKLKRPRFGLGYGYPYYYYYSYYGNYRASDGDRVAMNGNGHRPLYHRPVEWVRARFHAR